VVKEVGSGTVSFQRESQPPMLLRDVLYVYGLKKKLISVSNIEERGYEVFFCDGQVLIFPKGSNITSAKVIGIDMRSCTSSCFSQLVHCIILPTKVIFLSYGIG
jgi:hypothetical protein